MTKHSGGTPPRAIHAGPGDEEGYGGSYPAARRYAGRRRKETTRERGPGDAQGYLEPGWTAGECQVDFGEADLGAGGAAARGRHPAAGLPRPDVGIAQVFWGETSECVCEGPRSVFALMGGVPPRAVFDNATEVGRRFGTVIRTSEALRAPRRPLRLRLLVHEPLFGKREGERRGQGRPRPSQPLRADARLLRREGPRPKANAGVPGAARGKAPPGAGRGGALALRG